MRVIVVGGGKVGGALARRLVADGHTVTVFEPDTIEAPKLADTVGCLVIEGDGTDVGLLESADVARADWLLAVTGQDEVNLVAAELGEALGGGRLQVVARVNDPRNERTFEALGIRTVSVTRLVSQIIANTAEVAVESRIVLGELGGNLTVIEVVVPDNVPPRAVMDLALPVDAVLVRVTREGAVIIPRGHTVIQAGDRVLAVTSLDLESGVKAALCEVPE
ncbi:MAG TPA: NAD-binding protein [Acidimicrobiia bacterium]|nr:NAD-binding protein [Acidimicrobiia bacterium]